MDKIARELEQDLGKQERQDNGVAAPERTFYASAAYLQFDDDTRQFDELRDKGDYEGILTLAKEYCDGSGMDEEHTYATLLRNGGDELVAEDKDFAVVYNGSVGEPTTSCRNTRNRRCATTSGVTASAVPAKT